MNILAVNTATSKLSVVLSVNDKIYSVSDGEVNHAHSVKIMGAIDRVLADAGVDIKSIDCLAAVVGPGSFTGIRIGVAVINAFSLSLGVPPVAVTIFDTVPYNERKRLVLFDAKHGNYYAAFCQGAGLELLGLLQKEKIDGLDGEKYYIDESFAPNEINFIDAVKRRKNNPVFPFAPLYMRETEAERKCK